MVPRVRRVYARWWFRLANRSHKIISPVFNGYRYISPNRISRAYARFKSISR